MQRLVDLLKRFRKDERGVFLVIFAILALVLIATSGAVVDFTRVQQARTKAQGALDAAALALQATINDTGVTAATLKTKAQALLTERIADTTVTAVVEAATPDTTAGKLTISGYITVPTYFVQMVGITSIRAAMLAEVTRSSNDLEISVSLDVTQSMSGTKISDLIDATNTLIDLVVQTSQTPTYSKMAIVPWSSSLNVGSYAASVRGAVRGPWTISGASWATGTAKTVTAVTKANPGIVTTSGAHGFTTGDYVYFSGITGMTQINNKIYQITTTSTTKFKLNVTSSTFVNTSSYGTFSTSGTPRVTKCQTSTCSIVVTATGHALVAGEIAYITGVGGMAINNTYTVASPTTNTFVLSGTSGPTFSAYTSGGTAACEVYGCSLYYFQDAQTGWGTPAYQRFPATTCVSERTTNAYTDAAPSTTPLGFRYADSDNGCISQTIQPLTTDKNTLHALANSLAASGSTAGHLGLAWGWYMIAPNFASLWPTASQPAAYGKANLIKAVIFMTDGAFNTPYCNGVIASDALSGSGSSSDHINCNSPNGASKAQAEALCDAIKVASNSVYLYTVGFDLAGDTAALTFLEDCATSPDYFFQADDGTDLEVAFSAIASSLSELRISK